MIRRGLTKRSSRKQSEAVELLAPVCANHNSYLKTADSPRARKLLLERAVRLYGEERMRAVLDAIPFKTQDMTFDAIMAAS